MKIRSIVRCFLLTIFASSSQAASFHLMTENFPPLNMSTNGSSYARNDRVSGFATDIIRQLFSNTGHNVKFTLVNIWDEAYSKARRTPGYGVYSTLRIPERDDQFAWIGPLYDESWVLLAPIDSQLSIKNLQQAKQYKVGSYVFDGITDYLIENGLDIVPANNDAVNAIKLKTNDIDLWASSSLTGPYIASNFNIKVKPVLSFSKSNLWLAMNKDTPPEVIRQLNGALKEMHRSGQIQAMINGYNK